MSKESAIAAAQAQPTPASAQPAAPAPPAAPPQSDAARFAALALKESQNVKEREAIKKEREAFLAEKTALEAERPKVNQVLETAKKFEELRKTDRIAALKALGFSETDIFELVSNLEPPKEPTPEEKAAKAAEAAADAKIKAFQDAEAKKAEEAQKARDSQIVNGYKSEIAKFVEANKEKFEYCAFYGQPALDLAYETIVAGLRESKGEDLIDFKEAIQMVEDFYEEQDKAMSAIKKRQPAEAAPEAPKAPERTRTITQGDPNHKTLPTITRTRTLSNADRIAGDQARATAPRNETREQKRERLINQIKTNGLRK